MFGNDRSGAATEETSQLLMGMTVNEASDEAIHYALSMCWSWLNCLARPGYILTGTRSRRNDVRVHPLYQRKSVVLYVI